MTAFSNLMNHKTTMVCKQRHLFLYLLMLIIFEISSCDSKNPTEKNLVKMTAHEHKNALSEII